MLSYSCATAVGDREHLQSLDGAPIPRERKIFLIGQKKYIFLLFSSFDQEFLPQLRAAAKASDILGMSFKKAAVVNISTALCSLQSVRETLPVFGAIALGYRTSKASDNLPH